MKHRIVFCLLCLCVLGSPVFAQSGNSSGQKVLIDKVDTQLLSFRVVALGPTLSHPWSLAFLPDGKMLITERGGKLRLWDGATLSDVAGVPQVAARGQGGLLDIALDPKFSANQTLYFSYSAPETGANGTRIAKAQLDQSGKTPALKGLTVIYDMQNKTSSTIQYGSRFAFLPDGTLIVAIGDRGAMDRAQDKADVAGKVIRINTDGTIPKDNPGVFGRPEIYSMGHRNPQGIAIHPLTGVIWENEHGPMGGDEINTINPGKNYGWPTITYGKQYVTGAKIGEGTAKPGLEQPLWYWVPSIAPSGLAWYTGDKFAAWKGDLFVGALAGQLLVRLRVDPDPAAPKVLSEERMLTGRLGRIRDVRTGPDGFIYLLLDEAVSDLIRLEPLPAR